MELKDIDAKIIYNGWINALNYESLSESQKLIILSRAEICSGNPDKDIPKCENFVYSPTFAMMEEIVKVPLFILQNINGALQKVRDPKGRFKNQPIRTSTGEVTGVKGFKCNKCGCGLAAKVSSPDVSCPLKKW